MFRRTCGALVASLALAAAAPAVTEASVITFREGITNDYVTNYQGAQDTDVFQSVLGTVDVRNWGGITTLNAVNNTASGRRRFILSFDLGSLTGQGLVVESATLTLTKNPNASTTSPITPNTISVLDLVAGNAGWLEGRGNGTDALPGEATGQRKAHPDTTWTSGTNMGASPADFNGGYTADATGAYWANSAAGTATNFVLSAALVQGWIDNPASNAGLFFFTTSDSAGNPTVQFASGEHANEAWRPTLTLVVPEPGVLGLAAAGLPLLLARRRRSN